MPNSLYKWGFKRVFDLISAGCGVLLLSPVFVLAAIAVKLSGPGPVLFNHKRIGLNFKPFYTHKFRTMVAGADKTGSAITTGGDARITPIGFLLRKTKIDELPQLFNVLKGDMSLVGPRPEVGQYVEVFREDYKTVLNVRPGITDYAAIEYRNEEETLRRLSSETAGRLDGPTVPRYSTPQEAYIKEILPKKIVLYKKYIAELSFLTDLKIIAKTLIKLLN